MKQHDLLYIVISLFVVAAAWIGFSVYHAHVTSTITETQNIQVQPISPQFNRSIIDKLKTRTVIDPQLESSAPNASSSSSPTPSITISPSATPTAGVASASGGLGI